MEPSLYTVETFAPHVGSDFRAVVSGGEGVMLRLEEAKTGPSAPKVLQFSLFFQGPPSPTLSQGLYHLEHDVLGSMDIFLVPIAQDQGAMTYQAVFSRFREAGE
jgi:hypothetical protein